MSFYVVVVVVIAELFSLDTGHSWLGHMKTNPAK